MPDPKKTEHPGVINGIDVDAVQGLIETIKSDTGKGMTHWNVSSTWQEGTHSRAQVQSFEIGGAEIRRSFTIDIDEPAELGGANLHANPQEYLLAALNACMVVGYAALCSLNGIRLDKLEITTEGEIDLRGFFGIEPHTSPGYDSLRTRVTIKGDGECQRSCRLNSVMIPPIDDAAVRAA